MNGRLSKWYTGGLQNRLRRFDSSIARLFFRLLVLRALAAPVAKLRQFYLAFHFFLVFLAPVIDALAGRAREFD